MKALKEKLAEIREMAWRTGQGLPNPPKYVAETMPNGRVCIRTVTKPNKST